MLKSHFQSFDDVADPARCVARVAGLRRELARQDLTGFIVPRSDEHQNEYVPKSARRLAWLTGFTGSAGMAIVMADIAAIFVDGRYTLQVREQVDPEVLAPQSSVDNPPEAWLGTVLRATDRLGYDPWLHTPGQIETLAEAAAAAGAALVPVETNPVDAIWRDRPEDPLGAVRLYDDALAGRGAEVKLRDIRGALKGVDALVVSDPHALAWAFNIRGSDVEHTPLPLGYALIPKDGRPTVYLDRRKLTNGVRDALEVHAAVAEPSVLLSDLRQLGADGAKVLLDGATAAETLRTIIRSAGGIAEVGRDPIALMKATKTEAERRGSRLAHKRDAAAYVRFLHWFAENAPKGGLTEISAAVTLETFRRDTGALRDLAFTTISAFGPHAALPHYRVTTATDLPIGPGLYLVDSGAQYDEGTTDITRTVAVGSPDSEMRDRFTRVLKGHIAIARAVFPAGTSGAQLDSLARVALWEAGLDFDHGTGHGVGAYLSVHEGPQEISKRGGVALGEGMIVSNEPGYYKTGVWGIRIENLVLVEARDIPGAERAMLGFETLSLAPIDLALVETGLLTSGERDWLDDYHARVRDVVGPLVERPVRGWLEAATRPLGP